MSNRIALFLAFTMSLFLSSCSSETTDPAPTDTVTTEAQAQEEDDLTEWNNRIRREKFDIVLPEVMRKNNVDMWIHVMRETIPDPFGAEELGSTSGVFVFTDRGGDRIERAVLGRRWGASHAGETWRVDLGHQAGRRMWSLRHNRRPGSCEATAGRPGDGI